jgi:hypothetical protein
MDINNPLELALTLVLILLSVWFVERIIAGAFKTVIAILFIFGLLLGYNYVFHRKQKPKHDKPLPRFTVHDLTDYPSFEKKFDLYKKETIKDVKGDYYDAKKEIQQGK